MVKLVRSMEEEIFVYELICKCDTITQYGITVYSQDKYTDKVRITNISQDKVYVTHLLRTLADNLVSPIHCLEIVEELISEN